MLSYYSTMAELDRALEILNLVRLDGPGHCINVQKNPRAYGSMGLAPFEVEATAVVDARMILDTYLKQYPKEDRDRIRRELWSDYHDIQSVLGASIDLSFLDEEFGKVEVKTF